jgi:hypothetical protein
MKKQASDQQFHDRRHQERKRAEAARKPPPKKADGANSTPAPAPVAVEPVKPSNAAKTKK